MAILKQINEFQLTRVELSEFSVQPGPFCMSYGFDNSQLTNSIEKIGIINKPYIIKRKDQSIEIITGYRRIIALKELNMKKVYCFDLTDSDMSDYEILILALHDNLVSRAFNYVELSMIISILNNIVNDNSLIYEVCSLINISRKDYPTLLNINKLNDEIKQAISKGVLHIKTLELLLHMESTDILLLVNLINKLKLSYNYQLQFIDFITDILRIEKISISFLLNEESIQCLLSDDKKNIPQKAKEFMDYLRVRRNPNISRYQKIFEKSVKKLNLPSNIRVMNPGYFESEGYRLEINFNNGDELNEILIKLADKYNFTDLKDPWLNGRL
jgi:hypothetical protein